MRRRILLFAIIVAVFVLAGGFSFAVEMYFDLLWFQELGKAVVFTTILYAKTVLGSAALLSAFIFLYLNLWIAGRGPGLIQIGIPTPQGQITAYTLPARTLGKILVVASVLVAFLVGTRAADNWDIVWRWLHQVNFGKTDPVFGRDISFYFFTLPVLEQVVRYGLMLCVISGIGILVLYHFKGILSFRGIRGAGGRGRVGVHISILGAILFVLLAGDAYLDRFQILYSNSGPMFGATYADLHARLPLLSVLVACALAGAVLWVYNAFASTNRPAILAVAAYVAGILVVNAYPALLQKFVVAPNELSREWPQIDYNIKATLRGYGLEKVEERTLSGDKDLTPADIQANAATIRSIRLWDHQPLLDAFSQIQEIRTYYNFSSVDNDRYWANGEAQQFMLSARELKTESLPERNWINDHLSYTHGYGLTLGPVNRVTPEGLPLLQVQDIPPRSTLPVFKIDRPEVYFGEQTTTYAVVRTGAKEFDYPAGEDNVYTVSYQGSGGVPVHSFLRKLLFAVYFRDANIVLSPLLKPESRFLYFRDIKTRASRVAPFLQLDQDPYMVISQGRLFWIQDGYTTADRYPYSTPTRGAANYIRNSVKIILDAYNGSADIYVSDPDDPLIQVYQRIFPGIFRPLDEMPADLRRHLRYPEDIFRIQTYIYSIYHMTHPQIFYNKEDLWEIPMLGPAGSETPMSPYYTIMRLPRERQEEFILMLPFTPGRKDNLSAWIVGRCDAANYGQLVVYRFPKKKLVYGPKQIAARINQDAEISRQVSLWDQRGSQVMQGTLLVIPIEEGLLYIRPLYLRAESGKIPELKRVIVAYENRIAMEETLEASIAKIFELQAPEALSAQTPAPPLTTQPQPGPQPETADLIRQAKDSYDRAISAQRQGDWARYGEEIKRLGNILEELKKKGK
jgi:uncharacterized membrane protein (UPF0182 family)